jgi:hypothetical protein
MMKNICAIIMKELFDLSGGGWKSRNDCIRILVNSSPSVFTNQMIEIIIADTMKIYQSVKNIPEMVIG